MGGLSNGPIPGPLRPPNPKKPGVEKSQFQISANHLEVVENVNRTLLSIHWLVLKGAMNNRESPK